MRIYLKKDSSTKREALSILLSSYFCGIILRSVIRLRERRVLVLRLINRIHLANGIN